MAIESSEEIKKTEGWELRLSAILMNRRTQLFQWGVNDCALWPADVVLELSGIDPATPFRGTYNDEAGAAAIIAEYGSMENLFTSCLGFETSDNWKRAKRGDIVLMELEGGVTGGVVDDTGEKIAVFATGDAALIRVPLKRAALVWSY
jgi:hypothetical protein